VIFSFYHTRDAMPWPEPEYADTVNTVKLGNLVLVDAEEDANVLFMTTLSDKLEPKSDI